jgi:hypothetical protein
MADEPQADGGDYRPEDATCTGVQNAGAHNNYEAWPDCERKRTQPYRCDCKRSQCARRLCGVNQRATGNLRSKGNQSARCQHEPNVELRPVMRGQIDGDERSKAGLYVCKKESEPVEPTLPDRWYAFRLRRRLRPGAKTRRNFGDETVYAAVADIQC